MTDQFVFKVESKTVAQDILTRLTPLNADSSSFQNDLNNIVEHFNSIFVDSAHETWGIKLNVKIL